MAKNKNIEVVTIDIGLDIEKELLNAIKSIDPETEQNIKKISEEISIKQNEKLEKKLAKEQDKQKLQQCINKLLQSSESNKLSADELLEMSGKKSMSGLISTLKKNIKYKIIKCIIEKKVYYWIDPNSCND